MSLLWVIEAESVRWIWKPLRLHKQIHISCKLHSLRFHYNHPRPGLPTMISFSIRRWHCKLSPNTWEDVKAVVKCDVDWVHIRCWILADLLQ
jgi:hypothetical protein